MSVQSFGFNILDAKVKSLTAQHDLHLSTIDASGYGREYTHHINGPNVGNPNNYVFSVYEKGPAGQANQDLITVTTTNAGAPPFNDTYMTIKPNVITLDGWVWNTANNPSVGRAEIDISNTEVAIPRQNVKAGSVILVTPISQLGIGCWVEAGVNVNTPADNFFTIKVPTALTAAAFFNYNILTYPP
jgi:hypothetical protein